MVAISLSSNVHGLTVDDKNAFFNGLMIREDAVFEDVLWRIAEIDVTASGFPRIRGNIVFKGTVFVDAFEMKQTVFPAEFIITEFKRERVFVGFPDAIFKGC